MRLFRLFPFLLIVVFVSGCLQQEYRLARSSSSSCVSTILSSENGFTLLYHGEPFVMKGATAFSHFSELAEIGGNTVRFWDTDSSLSMLDQAYQAGLATVLVLNVLPERKGMDYNSRSSVLQQRQRIAGDVKRNMNHPGVLMWCLGNELELNYTNQGVWRELDTLSRLVLSIDSTRLITTSIMPRKETITMIRENCPFIEVLGINSFGFVPNISSLTTGKDGWKKPYFLSEWGAKGYWEVEWTDWNAPYEQPSSQKASYISWLYESHISQTLDRSLGSLIFFWGPRQERTHTWFSLINRQGQLSETAEVVGRLWQTGKAGNSIFEIEGIAVGTDVRYYSFQNMGGDSFRVRLLLPDDQLQGSTIRWEIRPEGDYNQIGGGDKEKEVLPVTTTFSLPGTAEAVIASPTSEGPYRVFAIITNKDGIYGTANRPFYIGHPAQKKP